MDINAMFLFLDAFGLGATWRMGDSIDFLAYFQAAEQFRIGLGYDYSLTELQDYNNGRNTHMRKAFYKAWSCVYFYFRGIQTDLVFL